MTGPADSDKEQGVAPIDDDLSLFDDDDVDVGEVAPGGEEITDDELAAVRASQADPSAAAADDPEVG